MPNSNSTPLSSTVSPVFDQFLKKLESEGILGRSARDALAANLHGQKLDHVTLRKALFESEPKK